MMTIQDTASRIGSGVTLSIALGDFLDEFYRQTNQVRAVMLAEEPQGLSIADEYLAILAAATHKLANDYDLAVPEWVFKRRYYLRNPYFSDRARGSLRLLYMYQSPPEFKHRNIFTSRDALSRA